MEQEIEKLKRDVEELKDTVKVLVIVEVIFWITIMSIWLVLGGK